jgi:hypothetical protein
MDRGDGDARARLADAAARLKAAAQEDSSDEPETLAGLVDARLELRRARSRLAELEADLRATLDSPDAPLASPG